MSPFYTITNFDNITSPNANSVLWIVSWPFLPNSDKQISLNNLFGNVTCNVYTTQNLQVDGNTQLQSVTANNLTVSSNVSVQSLTVTSNTFVLSSSFTPVNSSVPMSNGSINWDDNYLYIKTSTGLKRVALESF